MGNIFRKKKKHTITGTDAAPADGGASGDGKEEKTAPLAKDEAAESDENKEPSDPTITADQEKTDDICGDAKKEPDVPEPAAPTEAAADSTPTTQTESVPINTETTEAPEPTTQETNVEPAPTAVTDVETTVSTDQVIESNPVANQVTESSNINEIENINNTPVVDSSLNESNVEESKPVSETTVNDEPSDMPASPPVEDLPPPSDEEPKVNGEIGEHEADLTNGPVENGLDDESEETAKVVTKQAAETIEVETTEVQEAM